jgi:DNA-binding transcriptional ArsR family regulator
MRIGCARELTAHEQSIKPRYMVNHPAPLDRTFAALVDPTRRAILARLEREGSASISALKSPFAIKLPAVMKHLDVLDEAGLITRTKRKVFFSEEKKQKTFANSGVGAAWKVRDSTQKKSFGSFLQKRTPAR